MSFDVFVRGLLVALLIAALVLAAWAWWTRPSAPVVEPIEADPFAAIEHLDFDFPGHA